jgi:hypothetical protein
MITDLKKRRANLVELLQQTAVKLEQIRGALALCEELIRGAEENGHDLSTISANERKDGEPLG